jgi:hypothetical protein
MPLQTSGAISMNNIATEYHMDGNKVDIGRMAVVAGVGNNIGAFYGKSYIDRFGTSPNISQTTPGEMQNADRRFEVNVRICIGINGSDSGSNASRGWIWSKSNGGNGGNIYIYNNILTVVVGADPSSPGFTIPSNWTNDVIREIVWVGSRYGSSFLVVDGVIRDETYSGLVPFVGALGRQYFLQLPTSSGNIGNGVPSAARVSPVNIVAKRCDVWLNDYYNY